MKTEVIFPVYNEADTLSNQIKKFNDYFDINYRKNLIITTLLAKYNLKSL